jgi:hypothetical protein
MRIVKHLGYFTSFIILHVEFSQLSKAKAVSILKSSNTIFGKVHTYKPASRKECLNLTHVKH